MRVRYPRALATIARPMPVLPAVASTTSPPGLICPRSSASKIIWRAARSFTDWPGFMNSALPRTVHPVISDARRSLISGVLPIASRTSGWIVIATPPLEPLPRAAPTHAARAHPLVPPSRRKGIERYLQIAPAIVLGRRQLATSDVHLQGMQDQLRHWERGVSRLTEGHECSFALRLFKV